MTGAEPRAELYVRTLAPTVAREVQEHVVERLEALAARDAIREYDVVVCGECVCPQSATAETEPGQTLLERYESFEQWAAERDRELVGFQEHEETSLLTGSTISGIEFPRMVLAEYCEGSLEFVAPSTDGDETTAVTERLDAHGADGGDRSVADLATEEAELEAIGRDAPESEASATDDASAATPPTDDAD